MEDILDAVWSGVCAAIFVTVLLAVLGLFAAVGYSTIIWLGF